MPKYKS